MTLVRLEPAAHQSRVKYSTTEPLRSHKSQFYAGFFCLSGPMPMFVFQASRGHNEALHVLIGCIMNLDIKDVNGKWFYNTSH